MNKATDAFLLDDSVRLNITEIADMTGVRRELIIEMVSHDILRPVDDNARDWVFAATYLVRVQRALRLRRDLELNWPGVGLALDLLEELDDLRRQHRNLLQRLR